MQRQLLQLKFKGSRTYVHGTDMFNQTLEWISSTHNDIRDIDFAFHRLASRQLEAVAGAVPEGVQPVALCTYTRGAARDRAYLVETDVEVTDRYPYPEDQIVEAMAIDEAARRGVLREDSGYTDIEVWVAMTKALHIACFPELRGKWLFVRGRFAEYARRSSGERTIAIASVFSAKLTRTEASIDGRKVGDIFFSMV